MIRMELPQGSYMIAKVRCDGKPWQECGRVVGRDLT